MGIIHQALFCQANSKNSPINLPRYLIVRIVFPQWFAKYGFKSYIRAIQETSRFKE
jgi:hypothetical protein